MSQWMGQCTLTSPGRQGMRATHGFGAGTGPTSALGTTAAQGMALLQALSLLTGTGAEAGKKNEHLEVHMNKLMPQGCQSCANTLS